MALGTGLITFDWSWKVAFPLRDKLFAIHRVAGMIVLVAALVWLMRFGFPRSSFVHGGRHHLLIRAYHAGLAALAVMTALFAWIGRGLDGRWAELVSPLPVYNFVSRPDVPLAHTLLSSHALLARALLVALTIHAVAAAGHWLKDRFAQRTGDRG